LADLHPTARVARGATYIFIQGFGTAVVGLVYFAILARVFGSPEEQWQMGAYALLSFVLSFAQYFGTLSLQSAAVKYIARYLAEGKVEKAKAVAVRVLQVGVVASVVAFLGLFVPADWISVLLFGVQDHAFLIRLVAVCTIFMIFYVLSVGILQGLQRMRDIAFIGLSYSLIHTGVGVFLLFLGWRLLAVVVGWLAGWIITSIAALVLVARHLGVTGKPHSVRPLMSFSLPLYFSSGVGFIVAWIDQLLLVSYMSLLYGTTEGQTILGIYYVAIRAAVVPTLFSNALVVALFPSLSELYAQQGLNSLRDAFRVASRYSILVGFPLIIGLATLAYPVIILFGGWQYIDAAIPLIIISIAALIATLGLAMNPILLTLERTVIASALSVVSVALSLFFAYLMVVPLNLGMNGAAWARTLTSILSFVLTFCVLSRHVPLSFDKKALWKASVASVFLVAAIVGLDLIRMLLSPSSYQFLVIRLHLLPIYVIAGGLAYFIALIMLKTLTKRDLEIVEEYLPGKLQWIVEWLNRFVKIDQS
jgi:O-antigen/teichoic acid export membrane protein